MRIYFQASEEQKVELGSLISNHSNLIVSDSLPLTDEDNFDVFFILDENPEQINFNNFNGKPVFINEVISTITDLGAAENVYRINAWPTFLQRDIWEVAGSLKPGILEIFEEIGKKAIFIKDVPGMVSARVISMIINEAFYALNEDVSTKPEIDLAMKLGTNYPYGPFEWCEKIGRARVYDLLSKLSINDERCIPAFERNGNSQFIKA